MTRSNLTLAERDVQHVVHAFTNLAGLKTQPPIPIVAGRGIYIIDDQGQEYIEGCAGMWCASLGFSEGALIDAAIEQFRKLPYYHSFVDKTVPPLAELAEKLCALAPPSVSHAFVCNSGSEANDTLIKLIWYYNNAKGRPKKKKIVSRENGFHGLTVAASSLTGIPVMHADFDLPLPGFLKTDLPHHYRRARPGESEEDFATRLAESLDALIRREGAETVAAFVAEPVMGAGGVIVPPRGYFAKIEAVLKAHDVLMVADEVITGFGRTGTMFACESFGIHPDAVTVAKALSSAYQPIAAVLISDAIYQALVAESGKLGFFAHGFTTGGHPVAAAVALRTLELMEERDIVGHVRRVSPAFADGLRRFLDHPLVGEVRGMGLMGAIEIVADKASKAPFPPGLKVKERVRLACQKRGLIVRACTGGDSFAFAPPLIITEAEIAEMFRRFRAGLDEVAGELERAG